MTRRAFTLLEVLLAIAMLGIVAAGLTAFLQSVADQRARLDTSLAQQRDVAVLFERIDRALVTTIVGGGSIGPGVRLTPDSLSITFVDQTPDRSPLVSLVVRSPSGEVAAPVLDDTPAFLFDETGPGLDLPAPTDQPPAREAPSITLSSLDAAASELTAVDRIRFRANNGSEWTDRFDTTEDSSLPRAIEVSVWFRSSPDAPPDRRRVFTIPGIAPPGGAA